MVASWSRSRARRFFESYKEIEALWEILSPSPKLRDHIETYKWLAQLYAAVRNNYRFKAKPDIDLANKTREMVQDSLTQEGLGELLKTVTFDVRTLKALQRDPGSNEAKVFNLVRGLRAEMEASPDLAPVLQSIKERAEQVIEALENHKTTSLAALDSLAELAKEKEETIEAARDSALTTRAFSLYWTLRNNEALKLGGVEAISLAQEAEALLARFPNAASNTDEQRRLRAALYHPLLALGGAERLRIVEIMLKIMLDNETDEYS